MVSRKLFLFIGILLVSFSFISAWEFNGTAYDVNGNVLYNATINITFWTMASGPPSLVGSNSTYSNESGWFNLTVHENVSYMYKPVIRHFENNKTDGSTSMDYIGQSLPQFPFSEFANTTGINFYLREAGTINITAINQSGGRTAFNYMIKDTKLGYPIEENFGTGHVSEAIIYVPRNRNYSVMIYPNASMPVNFDWNNFSSANSYNITVTNLSQYTNTTHTLQYQFNCTNKLVRVTGYINKTEISGWDEFTVVPFLLEPGNMVYLSEDVGMPYNMSAWNAPPQSDKYTLTSGEYNITLIGSPETISYILFATARNGTNYYGGYRNLTLDYSASTIDAFNFTMYPLMSTDWGTATGNITLKDSVTWNKLNISSAKQKFNLVNATNITLENVDAHLEVTVDYSAFNCTEFTFMTDLNSENGTFYIPLINATGVKEMNIFSMSYAPKRVGTMTAAEIISNPNITMAQFNPGAFQAGVAASSVFIELYKSNSSCDVPNPPVSCNIGGTDDDMGSFNPLSSIIGGGKISFRMGYGNIKIHYVNVDMLASGPPDIKFDSSATESTTGTFGSALKFGSMGPTIYDYVLVSIPYTPGSTSTTGLNENAAVTMSMPYFYTGDNSQTLIWNTATNGTSAAALAGNYSHYSAKQDEWAILMSDSTCVTNVSEFNVTNPCYINTANNQIWIRIPHFDGNKPQLTGSLITATVTDDGTTSGSSAGTITETKIHSWQDITPEKPVVMKDFKKEYGIKQIQIEVNNLAQKVKLTVLKYDGKPANVSIEKAGKVYSYLQIKTENLEDKLKRAIVTIQVEKNWISENNLDENKIAFFKFDESGEEWQELITTYTEADDDYYYYDVELDSFSYFAIGEKIIEEEIDEEEKIIENKWFWLGIGIAVIVLVIVGLIIMLRKKR